MRRTLLTSALALPLLALPSPALAWGEKGPPIIIDAGISYRFNIYINDGRGGAPKVPWYLYWPVGATAQAQPQPNGYPNWPGQGQQPGGQAAPSAPAPNQQEPTAPVPPPAVPGLGQGVPGMQAPPPGFAPLQRTAYQPGSATPQGVPSYWFSR
jgi:hypothetical protein